MSRNYLIALAVAVLALGIVGFSALFTVQETQQALVLQFGEPIDVVKDPGMHFKLPLIQNVTYYEDRVLDFDAAREEVPTVDQKQVIIDAFARYRITDPLEFFKTVATEAVLRTRLNSIISSNMRKVVGGVLLTTVLTDRRTELMREIADRVNDEAKSFGIEVIDVRLKRVDLPDENSQAIFRRMQTQREQEARLFRAEGQRDARRIRADAEKQSRVIVAQARKQSEITRGEGDAEATRVYNEAYAQDPAFFDFFRSMQAISKGLNSETTRYVGPPEGDFFRYFQDLSGREVWRNTPSSGGAAGSTTGAAESDGATRLGGVPAVPTPVPD
jgi:membrane protease subunit HflC